MTSEEIYKNLLSQYEKLTLEEKRAILIYKSDLYRLINPLSAIPYFYDLEADTIIYLLGSKKVITIFEWMKKKLYSLENMTIRYTIFSSIDFQSLESFIESLKNICRILKRTFGSILLPEDLVVYRGVSIENNVFLVSGTIGSFLSTALEVDDTSPFLFYKSQNHIFIIHASKGSPVLVSPYSLISTYSSFDNHLINLLNNVLPNQFRIVKNHEDCQKEIIFPMDDIIWEEQSHHVTHVKDEEESYEATVHDVQIFYSKGKEKVKEKTV